MIKALFFCLFIYFCYSYPVLDISGFSWAENLAFDYSGNVFISDTTTGILYRISLSEDGNSYEKFIHIEEGLFDKVNGLTMKPNSTILYASVKEASSKQTWIMGIDTTIPNTYTHLVPIPVLGNGLAYHELSGNLYTTNEGNFYPGKGIIYLVSLTNNETTVAFNNLEATDGCFIDQERNLLYISNVIAGNVLCFQIQSDSSLVKINHFAAPDMIMLDDFTLNNDGSLIYGADYRNGTVVIFNSDGSSETGYILMENLLNPTSVRFSQGLGFNTSCVYVTEGGGKTKRVTNRQVLQSPYAL